MAEDADFEAKAGDFLCQFERILESDLLIDEIGFIHPSQFSKLKEEAGGSKSATSEIMGYDSSDFLLQDHKLGVSTEILHPLYIAARNTFMAATRKYRSFCNQDDQTVAGNHLSELSNSFNIVESEVMKHSRALLLLSCDFGTAWNSRKFILSKKQHLSMYLDELLLSKLVLSYFPKSEQAWCHRRWVIKLLVQKGYTVEEILKKESELVERIAEMSKMNYRAWNHRCWLVSYMSREQVLNEVKKTRKWAALHVADNCCFHYRRRLMLKILEDITCTEISSGLSVDIYQMWKEELDWDEMLIKRYVGREALWIHRRFLSACWMIHFVTDPNTREQEGEISNNFHFFFENELNLVNSCSFIPNDDFEDFQAQATYSGAYLLWLIKNCPKPNMIQLDEKLKACNLKTLLYKVCPEGRYSLWKSLIDSIENSH
ncbi:protein prenyltransferase alpha subunit repeat-containing protein 1 isoform X1 [Cucurbita moschata]|uniref:Protein prenyltransferase alpha subunit repeat-containing protein 1 isoform X1 n=1 Tax=Cucurbita moschata TaxID=3662 RepID=A0A6J1FBP7_CUCMO|nr:protein prenyltransferase alpha subunit repeat-containing protein 1 isoform X1 [Cucurbita moschata]